MEVPPPPPLPQMHPPPIPIYSPVHPMTTLEEIRPAAAATAPAPANIPLAAPESAQPSADDPEIAVECTSAPPTS